MLPIAAQLDDGLRVAGVLGGATFDACIRFPRRRPVVRLRELKSHAQTPLQMLLRG